MITRSAGIDERTRPQTDVPGGVLAADIEDIELGLLHDDPDFVRRVHRLRRADNANTFTVVVLLAVSAVLLSVGLATLSPFAWFAGGLVFLATFGVDGRHQRLLGREVGTLRRSHDRTIDEHPPTARAGPDRRQLTVPPIARRGRVHRWPGRAS